MIADGADAGLPPSWRIADLKNLVTFRPKIREGLLEANADVSFLPMPRVSEVRGTVDLTETIAAQEGKRRNLTYIEDGDVIFAKITPCMENGKIARPSNLTNGAAFGSTEFHVMRPGPEIDGDFLRLFLVRDDFRYEAERAMTGAVGQRRVPRKFLEEYQLCLPPLAEQERIVEILEEHLSRLDAALDGIRTVRAKAAQFRRSLFRDAFLGVLTGEGSAQGGVPEGWEQRTLGDLVEAKADIVDGPFGSNLKSAHYTAEGARVVRLQNIGYGRFVEADAFISLEHYRTLEKHNVVRGDLLFASLGENLPRTCIAPDLGGPAIVKADCIRVRLSPSVEPNYVLYSTLRPEAATWATDQIHGMGRPRLGLGNIRAFPVPVPPRETQRMIVSMLDGYMSKVDATLEAASSIERRAADLRRSLLHAAFTGRLTEDWREQHRG